jgi:hypothetical protein
MKLGNDWGTTKFCVVEIKKRLVEQIVIYKRISDATGY